MGNAIDSRPDATPAVGRWLLLCCAMVAAMVILGGATRLTESGLSIVNWRPISGIMPPLNTSEWQALFDAYRLSPEFKRANFWMTLDDFKTIFWLEYLHRLWGRLIGLVFLIPFLWFLFRGHMSRAFSMHLIGLFVLGGLQGLMGWYMVRSGLVDQPSVSQYRLAAHLVLAFLIYGWLLWLALRCLWPTSGSQELETKRFRGHAISVVALAMLTVTAGAFVAGLDAGLAYNTFPKMGDQWVPEGLMRLQPWWINFFENTATVQFVHRMLGMTIMAVAIVLWVRVRRAKMENRARRLIELLAAVVSAQAAIGVATLLHQVPVGLGVLHQGGALVVFTLAILVLYELGNRPSAAVSDRLPKTAAPSK